MHLSYDHTHHAWVLGIDGIREALGVYEVHSGSNQPWTKLAWVETQQVGLGNKVLVALWQQGQQYPLLFYVVDIEEVSDSRLYWTQWRPGADARAQLPRLIRYCDTLVPYLKSEGCLLFLCQRAFQQEPEDPHSRYGPGSWHLAIAAYRSDGTLILQEPLPETTFPIRNLKVPKEDFFKWLQVRMNITEGPPLETEGRRSCVAALVLQDSTASSPEEATKGGLYWIDMQGQVMRREVSSLGGQISLCLCAEAVIGTDIFENRRRLWRWSPLEGTERHTEAFLSPRASRATLVAGDRQEELSPAYFWCVEEYREGVSVSRWTSQPMRKLGETWCEGITLVDELVASYVRDRQPKGVVADRNALLLLGIDKEHRLNLWRVQ